MHRLPAIVSQNGNNSRAKVDFTWEHPHMLEVRNAGSARKCEADLK